MQKERVIEDCIIGNHELENETLDVEEIVSVVYQQLILTKMILKKRIVRSVTKIY